MDNVSYFWDYMVVRFVYDARGIPYKEFWTGNAWTPALGCAVHYTSIGLAYQNVSHIIEYAYHDIFIERYYF